MSELPPAANLTLHKGQQQRRLSRRALVRLGVCLGLGLVSVPIIVIGDDFRIATPEVPFSNDWATMPIQPRGSALLGISFRPLKTAAFGLPLRPTLSKLLEYPIQMVRLGAYWNLIETHPNVFDFGDLDWQLDAVEQAGAQVILNVGAVKTFGFPEFHIPAHHMPQPFPDGTVIGPKDYPDLAAAAVAFIERVVDRYAKRLSIVAWQVENEPLEPIYFVHNWSLSRDLVQLELDALRRQDPVRPVMINGNLPTALGEEILQAWVTRGQGDSLQLASDVAQLIGLDVYPRVAIAGLGAKTLYLDSTDAPWDQGDRDRVAAAARSHAQRVLVAEGQAEPWELSPLHIPPSPRHRALFSCTPSEMIALYNAWAGSAASQPLYAYLFWGADYWILRAMQGDPEYLNAFARILENP
jgi:Beta-galactosidase